MEALLAVVGSLIFIVLLLVLWQVYAIKKKLSAKDSGPGDGGTTPPLPTKSYEDDSPNNPSQDPPLPT